MLDVNPPGPAHAHELALTELALSVTVAPVQIRPVLVAPVDEGIGFTVTTVVYTVAGAQPLPVLLTVKE